MLAYPVRHAMAGFRCRSQVPLRGGFSLITGPLRAHIASTEAPFPLSSEHLTLCNYRRLALQTKSGFAPCPVLKPADPPPEMSSPHAQTFPCTANGPSAADGLW